jgi:hypothetical protein
LPTGKKVRPVSVRLSYALITEIDDVIPILESECGGETTTNRGTAIRYLIRTGLKALHDKRAAK